MALQYADHCLKSFKIIVNFDIDTAKHTSQPTNALTI